MNTYTEDQAAMREELWRAWVQRGKLRDAAAARKLKVVSGLAVGLAAGASALYVMLARQGSW